MADLISYGRDNVNTESRKNIPPHKSPTRRLRLPMPYIAPITFIGLVHDIQEGMATRRPNQIKLPRCCSESVTEHNRSAGGLRHPVTSATLGVPRANGREASKYTPHLAEAPIKELLQNAP